MDLVNFLSFIYMDNICILLSCFINILVRCRISSTKLFSIKTWKRLFTFFYSLVITVTTDQNLVFLFCNNLLTSTTFENDCIFDDLIIILHVDFILTILFETMIFFSFHSEVFYVSRIFFLFLHISILFLIHLDSTVILHI